MPPSKKKPTSIIIGHEAVAVEKLKPHPQNPNEGNVSKVAKSLRDNGQFRDIIVNKGTKAKSLKDTIVAGHHTWLGARQNEWETVDVSWIDVDADTHKRIMLADNKTRDGATTNEELLAEILGSLSDPTMGTGFESAEVDNLLKDIANMPNVNVPDSLGSYDDDGDSRTPVIQKMLEDDDAQTRAAARGATLPDLSRDADEHKKDDGDDQERIMVLHEAFAKREEDSHLWKTNDWYGIPGLRRDMLMDTLPTPFDTWAGEEATPDDGKTTWLWNYGLGGTKGLPFDRAVVSFFTHDEKFDNWWAYAAFYLAKFMSRGLTQGIVPDFSFYYTEPRIIHLWGVYKAQWIGRFMQECGMKVMPRLQFDYMDEDTLKIATIGIPKNPPILISSMQNVESKENEPRYAKLLRQALDELQPEHFITYGGPPSLRVFEASGWTGNHSHLDNYAAKRRKTVFDKEQGLKAKKKEEAEVKKKEREEAKQAALEAKERGEEPVKVEKKIKIAKTSSRGQRRPSADDEDGE